MAASQNAQATEHNVMLDVLAVLDDSPSGRLIGSDYTTMDAVGEGISDSIVIELDNGQQFRLIVREILS